MRIATIVLPSGYKSAEDFAKDCGVEMPTAEQIAAIIMEMDIPKRQQVEIARVRAERDAARIALLAIEPHIRLIGRTTERKMAVALVRKAIELIERSVRQSDGIPEQEAAGKTKSMDGKS